MKVLIVHPQMALYAGAEIVVVRLAHYLQEHGHKVSILTLSTAPHKDYEGLNFILPKESERMQYRLRGSIGAVWDILRMYRTLNKLCKEHADDFDVINVHNFPAIWTAPSKKRIVWMCNEIPELWHGGGTNGLVNQLLNTGRLIDRFIARSKSPIVVVPDEKCTQRFQHRYGFQPEIIPYGIDSFATVHQPSNDTFTVMHAAMISPSKNQMAVLEAVRELRQSIQHIKVVFSGYREPLHPYTLRLLKYVVDNDLSQHVLFAGQMSREKLRDLYCMSHVAIFPGKGQGSWLGPFEQLSAGIPIIVSPNLSCSAIIAGHDLGTVTDDITSAIRETHDNYPKYQQQALRGREFVLRELTWDNFGMKMMELMEE